ncbi:MAG: 2-keto-4-pentenoate hydratase [Hyphomicrobiales bacterium]|nr:2-keto-4-pentenoate hydratase [Hyphomicrobiales bacterium]
MTTFQLATIETADGPRAALIMGDKAVEIAKATGLRADETVLGIFEDFDSALPRLDALASSSPGGVPLSSVRLLSPIPVPPAIYCAGSNYADHAAEMAKAQGRDAPKDPHELGQRSWHFIKSSRSAVGPDATVAMPAHTKKLDWEAELGVVIGRTARNVSEADALDYVGGYLIGNDLSARDLSRRANMPDTSSFKNDWMAHKSFDGACPLGPWITLARDVTDPHNLKMVLDVNGVAKQDSNSGQMIFDIREQIADLSARMTLHPGDIILTGTPAGVGNGRGEFLKSGDKVSIRIEGLGELVTHFV